MQLGLHFLLRALLAALLGLPGLVVTQVPVIDKFKDMPPRGCEFNTVDFLAAHSAAEKDSVIILVSRMGVRDRNPDISRRRLHTAQTFLTSRARAGNPYSVLVAESLGSRSRATYGGVEVYVNGILANFVTSKPNQDLTSAFCSGSDPTPEELAQLKLLYPWKFKK